MIRKSEPLSMVEAQKYLKKDENAEILGFIKKFTKLKPEEAEKLRKKLEDLDLMRIKEESITKIIDVMPNNADELNKILVGISLNEDETKKILDTIKEFQ